MNWQLGRELVPLPGIPEHLWPVSKPDQQRGSSSQWLPPVMAYARGSAWQGLGAPFAPQAAPSKGQTTHPENSPPVPTYLPPAARGFGFARPQSC